MQSSKSHPKSNVMKFMVWLEQQSIKDCGLSQRKVQECVGGAAARLGSKVKLAGGFRVYVPGSVGLSRLLSR